MPYPHLAFSIRISDFMVGIIVPFEVQRRPQGWILDPLIERYDQTDYQGKAAPCSNQWWVSARHLRRPLQSITLFTE
jgi:hypothetical protein